MIRRRANEPQDCSSSARLRRATEHVCSVNHSNGSPMNTELNDQKVEPAPPPPAQDDPIVSHFMRWKWAYLGGCAAALAFVTLSQPGQSDSRLALRRVAIVMQDNSTVPLKHQVQKIVDQCTKFGGRPPTWEWNPFRWNEQVLRCYYINQQTNFPMTIDWRFKDIGKDASGTPFLLLNGVVFNDTAYEAFAAANLLFTVVPPIAEGHKP